MRVLVPTINDGLTDFGNMFGLWNEVNGWGQHVVFDFTPCRFLRQNAVAFLGGLARLIQHNAGSVTFDWNTLRNDIYINLTRNGFLSAFGGGDKAWMGHSIPYREDMSEDKKRMTVYLRDQWLGPGWVALSQRLREDIVSRVVEIYDNVFAHAQSPIGVTSCGQHYPRLQELKLTVVDFGIGIPANVRQYLRRPEMSAAEAISWALQPGNTTSSADIGRGVGLDLLKTFVKVNKGRLEIFSGDGYAIVTEYVEHCIDREQGFRGTLVNITLQCDERFYCLSSEVDEGPLF